MVTAGMTKTHPLMMKMINRKEKKDLVYYKVSFVPFFL